MFSFFKKKSAIEGPIDFIIVGLGNPGRKYENTRHNAGFMAIDYIADREGVKIADIKFKSLCSRAVVAGRDVFLIKPQTFMNLSGQAVVEVMQFYKLPADKVILLFDDISLPVGNIRIRGKGRDGGHNGVKNIIYLSGEETFPRIKMGVGEKPPEWDLAAWVISNFSIEEGEKLKLLNEKIYNALKLIINGRIEEAMNLYNVKN
jgi:PTH1 family peptidyl-tRNA hydrolase